MNSILKKSGKSDAFNEENRTPYTKAIVLMRLIYFLCFWEGMFCLSI